MKFYQSSRNPRFNHDKRIKKLNETKDPMSERNPLVKSHITGDEIHEKILLFRGLNC